MTTRTPRRSTHEASASDAIEPERRRPQPTATYHFPLARGRSPRARSLRFLARSFAPAARRARVRACRPARRRDAADVGGKPLARRPASPPEHAGRRDRRRRPDRDPRHLADPGSRECRARPIAGMAARLAQTAEQDARLEAERRLLVSSIAHDLRTPLFSLRGYLDAIATGIGNPGERLERARAKAQQIDRLVTGLFDYARADFDKRPRLQTTDLAEAVTDATAAFELAADERGVKLQVTAHAGPSVTIDRDGFERALANVIDNALRHTPRRRHGRGRPAAKTPTMPSSASSTTVPASRPTSSPAYSSRRSAPTASRNSRADGAGLGLTIAARLLRQPRRHDRRGKRTPTRRDPHAPASAEGRITPRRGPDPQGHDGPRHVRCDRGLTSTSPLGKTNR